MRLKSKHIEYQHQLRGLFLQSYPFIHLHIDGLIDVCVCVCFFVRLHYLVDYGGILQDD